MSRRFLYLALMGWLAALLNVSPAVAQYREIPVKQDGTLNGVVTLKGGLPEERIFRLVLFPFATFCKKISDGQGNFHLQEFSIGPDGGLANTVVVIEDITAGKPFPDPKGESAAVDCLFEPFVSVVKNDQKIRIVNHDPIIHNVQIYQYGKGNIVFNQALPIRAVQEGALHMESDRRISQWICGMHEFMQKWAYVVDNPYYAITDEAGRFSIDRIPPGTYRVTAWHPHADPITQTVTVTAGAARRVDYAFDASTVERPLYERQTEGRIGRDARIRDDATADDDLEDK